MKSYSFAKVSARGQLTEADYKNKYIFTEDLKQVINVSDKVRLDRDDFFREKDIIVRNMPLTECEGDMGYNHILDAVRYLLFWDKQNKRSIVCCDFGVNRSRTVIEAFHYAKMGFHFEDEYKGYANHLIYNCAAGHLPELSEVEHELKRLGDQYNQEIQATLSEMKKSASKTCYNSLTEQLERFINDIKSLNIGNDKYDNLAPIMSSFTQVKLKDGYVLDGFQAGLPNFGSSMYLHARKENGTEFIPFDWVAYHRQAFRLSFREEDKPKYKQLKDWVDQYFKRFDDSMYVRKSVCAWHAEKYVRPIFNDLIVPFNEQGIWEATLIHLAPKFMPGYWHSAYSHIDVVTSEAAYIRKCKTLDDYNRYVDSEILRPKVCIQSDTTAIVSFAAWGWDGLEHWELKVTKDGDSVRFPNKREGVSMLLYYKSNIIL